MHDTAFTFLHQLHLHLDGQDHASTEALDAVALLTRAADPARAELLRPRPGEPAALVARLASWALHRVDATTIEAARLVLTANDRITALAS